MQIRIADTVNDSIVDGKGLRFTVFVQGCVRKCEGCHNPQTHDMNGGRLVDVDDLIAQATKNPLIDGITISGGEPFLQPDACLELAQKAHEHGLSVWTYTGFDFWDLVDADHPTIDALIKATDVLVDGRFIEEKKSYELHFRGSRNQRMIDVKETLRFHGIVEVDDE